VFYVSSLTNHHPSQVFSNEVIKDGIHGPLITGVNVLYSEGNNNPLIYSKGMWHKIGRQMKEVQASMTAFKSPHKIKNSIVDYKMKYPTWLGWWFVKLETYFKKKKYFQSKYSFLLSLRQISCDDLLLVTFNVDWLFRLSFISFQFKNVKLLLSKKIVLTTRQAN